MPSLNIYCSFHERDAELVRVVIGHLNTLFAPGAVRYTDRATVPVRANTAEFSRQIVEAADAVLIFGSADYFNRRETLIERDYARLSPRRPLVIPLRARATPNFPGLEEYPILPADGAALSDKTADETRCALAARAIFEAVQRFARPHTAGVAAEPAWLHGRDWKGLLFSHLDKNNLRSGIALLHRLIKDPALDRVAFEAEAEHQRLHRRTQQERLPFAGFWQQHQAMRTDMESIVDGLSEPLLRDDWSAFLCTECLAFQPIEHDDTGLTGLSTLADEIAVPHRLRENAAGDGLANEQSETYRRLFILAQDAEAMGQPGKAYAYFEQIRQNIDPESAQLYEHLLLTFVKKETPERIVRETMQGNRRLIETVFLLAGRYQEYQERGQCPSETGYYNVAEVAAELHHALRRIYAALPQDYVLDTGLNAERHPDQRAAVLHALQLAFDIYHFVHPAEGFLELAFNELCGGGHYQWLDTMALTADGDFRPVNRLEFDLLSRVFTLRTMLLNPEVRNAADPTEQAAHQRRRQHAGRYDQRLLLRDNLLLCLRRKLANLNAAVAEERRYRREFIDERLSLTRFYYACITGYLALEADWPAEKSTFLNLALDGLLRQPVIPWFTLNDAGELIEHHDCTRCGFAALPMTAHIIRAYAGAGGWEQVLPQIKATVYDHYIAETAARYEAVKLGLHWKDVRRWPETEARQALIDCIRRWMAAWRAYPERGEPHLQSALRELSGAGLLLWVHFDPDKLVTHPDSAALGYDAVAALSQIIAAQQTFSPQTVEKQVVDQLFQRRILPAYAAVKPGDEKAREPVVRLLREALRGYKASPDPAVLAWTYRELIDEVKFRWFDISAQGAWISPAYGGFQPLEVLEQLARLDPAQFGPYDTHKRVAERRYRDAEQAFYRDISEYRPDNGPEERRMAVAIFNKMKGIFRFFPDRRYLELPIKELDGHGRIVWQAHVLGIFAVQTNHHENYLFQFDYKAERVELQHYWDRCMEYQLALMDKLNA